MSTLEMHLIQNFAPSNLNRDDTGSPKDCEFGGFRRARISSQCQKKAMRNYFASASLLQPEELATRTKRAADIVSEHLIAAGKPPEQAAVVAMRAVLALKVPEDKKRAGLTGYLLYLSKSELDNLSNWTLAIMTHWRLPGLLTQRVKEKVGRVRKMKQHPSLRQSLTAKKPLTSLSLGGCSRIFKSNRSTPPRRWRTLSRPIA
jgi:CRISPR system Cascade subunit CasC